jgi:hypothetical protein
MIGTEMLRRWKLFFQSYIEISPEDKATRRKIGLRK